MDEMGKLPNIGKVMVAQLAAVGITTRQQLAQRGARQTWLDIKAVDPSACYNRLCGLQGAIEGVRWHSLPDKTKQDLKEFYELHKV